MGAKVNYVSVNYEFKELAAWREIIRRFAVEIPGISFLDIDETMNEIVISTEQVEASTPFILDNLQKNNIPIKAVRIEYSEKMVISTESIAPCVGIQKKGIVDDDCDNQGIIGPAPNPNPIPKPNYTLQSVHNKYVGGIQVVSPSRGVGCTLGLNVAFGFSNFRRGFITASHCTELFAKYDGKEFTQGSTVLGEEIVDRESFTKYTGDSYCDYGIECKYSDVALIEYPPSLHHKAPVGVIANPAGLGSIVLNDESDLNGFYVKDNVAWPYTNMKVHKVGGTTGKTTGKILQSCGDAYVLKDSKPNITEDYMFICVAKADYLSSGGDSGAPVITNSYSSWDYSYSDFEVMLAGFHLGGGGKKGNNPFAVFTNVYYATGDVDMGCQYANGWLNSELCDEEIGIGPFEIRAFGYRQ